MFVEETAILHRLIKFASFANFTLKLFLNLKVETVSEAVSQTVHQAVRQAVLL